MPSFDIVSEVDKHELTNAIDQANREVVARYDFKGSDANFALKENTITLNAQNEFQLDQMIQILKLKLAKRSIDLGHLKFNDPDLQHQKATQTIEVQQGIATEVGKKIIKLIKNSKLKVQAQIQGDTVRVSGKKRDDLQDVIQLMRADESLGVPFQYVNFRD